MELLIPMDAVSFTLLTAGLGATALLLLLVSYYMAMAPRKGTLEWIAFTKLPPLGSDGIFPVKGASWAVFPIALAAGTLCYWFKVGPVFEPEAAVCAVVSALAAAYTVLALNGNWIAAVGSCLLLFAFDLPGREETCLLITFLFLALACNDSRNWRKPVWLLAAVGFAAASCLVTEPTLGLQLPHPALPHDLRTVSLIPCLTVLLCPVQAVRLHRGRYFGGFWLSLLGIAGLFLGYPMLACWGGVLAVSCFAADSCRRRSVAPTVLFYLVFVLLIGLGRS